MSDFKINIDDSGFQANLVKYAAITGKTVRDALKVQAKSLSRRLMDLTPPENLGVGKKHVSEDINKVFADLGGTKWEDKSLKKMWREGNFAGVRKALRNLPHYYDLPISQYQRILEKPIRNIHWAAMGSSGRVPKKFKTIYAVGKRGEVKKYIKERQSRIGIAKSGWLAAANALGAVSPAYVKRHGDKRGRLVSKCYGVSPFLLITNEVKTFPRGYKARNIVYMAVQGQEWALAKNIEHELEKRKNILGK